MTAVGFVVDDDRGIIRVAVRRLRELADPLSVNPWTGFPLLEEEVIAEVVAPREHPDPETCLAGSLAPLEGCDACEIARIAHFVRNGWLPAAEDTHPISLDVGVGDYWPEWMITDGNHRVAAAIVARHEWVDVTITGSWDRAVAMLIDGQDGADIY